ncbi:MAG: hypothetical protein M0R51_08485 [Clostridia bacterium]|jgi:hypothetical protein|nr:hypothetical protein [Clostridia bacterium]
MDKCKFRNNCECFDETSVTCVDSYDRGYCGIFRRFVSKEIKQYKKVID